MIEAMPMSSLWRDERSPTDIIARHLATLALERSAAAARVDAFVRLGRVRLTGRVESVLMRADAEAAVRSVPGILGVVNEIEVSP